MKKTITEYVFSTSFGSLRKYILLVTKRFDGRKVVAGYTTDITKAYSVETEEEAADFLSKLYHHEKTFLIEPYQHTHVKERLPQFSAKAKNAIEWE